MRAGAAPCVARAYAAPISNNARTWRELPVAVTRACGSERCALREAEQDVLEAALGVHELEAGMPRLLATSGRF